MHRLIGVTLWVRKRLRPLLRNRPTTDACSRSARGYLAAVLSFLVMPTVASAAPQDKKLHLVLDGQPETVFTWSSEKCEDLDVPDAPLRAFRRDDGQVVAFAASDRSFPYVGSNLLHLSHDCKAAYRSKSDPDPAAHDEHIWITSTWTDDGKTVAALGHSEFHAQDHPGRCAKMAPNCSYNVVMLLGSGDGGRSFSLVSHTPVSAPPIQQAMGQIGTLGMHTPTDMAEFEGFKYAFVRSAGGGAQPPATCLLRAKDPMLLKSWEVFSDGRFEPSAFDPYAPDPPHPTICTQIPNIRGLVWSLVRHEGTGLFIALMSVIEPKTKKLRLAISTSSDMVEWSKPQIETDIEFQWGSKTCPKAPYWHYPTLLDPQSRRQNFDTIGDHPYLFMTRLNIEGCKGSLDRDLVRIPIRVTKE